MSAPRVLLTGASGFIAAHVMDQLLKKGFWVRATVRNEKKKQEILDALPEYTSQLEFVLVPDIAKKGAFNEAVKAEPGLDYIVHTASPFHFHAKDIKKDMLEPAVQGTVGVLEAAKKHAPTVKRIVITSSFASIVDKTKQPGPGGKVYSEKDWNPVTWEEAQEDPETAYLGSKKYAEKSAWDFLEKEKPKFDIVTLCPPMVYGPIINAQNVDSLNTSNEIVYNILSGKCGDDVPPTGTHLWVDVRDLAAAHVKALTAPKAGNQRFLIMADGEYGNQDIADILHKHFPNQPIPKGRPGRGHGMEKGTYYTGDNMKSKEFLRMSYGTLEDMLVPLAKSLLKLEKK
ncbi:putative NAD dependent epimerase/dehydratase [Auricularia subglabra TFB-10046 SS5]|nr:putative NAD dependent epimerase/dehydratase [Auricularia subglabra TFB-10046 SS5]